MCFHSALASINSWGGGFASQSSNTLDISGRTAISPTLPRAQVVPSRFWRSKLAAAPLDFESIEQALGCAKIWVPAIAVSQQTLPHVHESTTASRDAWPGRTLVLSAIWYKYFLRSCHSSIIYKCCESFEATGHFPHSLCLDLQSKYIDRYEFFYMFLVLLSQHVSTNYQRNLVDTSCPNTYSC